MAASCQDKPTIRVEVWSDVACPWCWVSWCRLSEAMEDLQWQAGFDVRWHAFLLDPNFAETGEEIESYYRRRFGSQAPALRQRLHDSGKWDGAPFADWRWRANTQGAHELIALAGRFGKSHQASGLLFRKTYEEGANLSERQQLLDAACALQLPPGRAEVWLGSQMAREAVAADDSEAKDGRNIHSVPTFFISCGASKAVQLVGAESVKAFEVAFRKAMHEAGGTPPAGMEPAGAAAGVGGSGSGAGGAGKAGAAAAQEASQGELATEE